jgi:hypothetical protein
MKFVVKHSCQFKNITFNVYCNWKEGKEVWERKEDGK